MLILEGLALAVATVLILVDYKLKNDLVELYKKMEGTLADGKQFFSENSPAPVDNAGLRDGPRAGDAARLEKATVASTGNGNGSTAAIGNTPAKRNGRTRNTQIPESDKQVGP